MWTLIYKITNKINGKIYIGQTSRSMRERWWEHTKPTRGKVSALTRAILKYGQANFDIEEICYTQDPSEVEHFFINQYNSLSPNGYNLVVLSESGMSYSPEERARRSMVCKVFPLWPAGKTQTEEHKHKKAFLKSLKVEGRNIETGERVSFHSLREATVYCCGKKNSSNIRRAITNNSTAYGYAWKILGKNTLEDYYNRGE